ncbi:MAG: hypothetical protein HY673_10095, partial [Chloroflexi bacterium]|nr:hypothetical protein [Chloroflexota bacterium]
MVVVELATSLTGEHKALVLRYLGEAERFSLTEWVTLLEAFTTLSGSTARRGEESLTFQAFYDCFVDQAYSDAFIADLFAETDVLSRAPAIQSGYARQIYQRLCNEPFVLGGMSDTECLLAYCLYWWASFARGYAFELEILRDLEVAGVHFTAHDLRVREQRFSPCDLTVLSMTGDIKNTTYFLYVVRSFPLTCDFYITRLYNVATRCYVRIIVLTDEAWCCINGD